MKPNWPTKKLGEVADYINGYPFSPHEWSSAGLPIIRIQNLNDLAKEYNYFGGEIDKKHLVNPNDILISWSASLGIYLWNDKSAWLNQHIFKVVVNENEIDRNFFFYIVQTKIEEMKTKAHGGTMQHITKNEFEKLQIPIPSIQIQKKIVERLDAIRKAQELCGQQIQKTEELFRSLLDKLLIRNISKWPSQSLKDIAINFDAKRKPVTQSNRTKGEYPYYGASGIVDYVDRYIFDEELLLISEDGANLLARVTPIAFPISGKTWVNNHAHVLRFKDIKTQKFVEYYLNRIDLAGYINGAAQPKLTQDNLNKIKIPYPKIIIQHQIVEKLEAVQNYKKLLLKQKSLLKELFDSVLDKSMKGELD